MRKIWITVLCMLTVCMLFACAEEEISRTESSAVSQKTPLELSAIPDFSALSLPEESLLSSLPESSAFSEVISIITSAESSMDASSEESEESEERSDEVPPESSDEESVPDESSENTFSEEESVPPPRSDPHMVNGFIVVNGRGMEPFGGSSSGGAATAEVFNEFKRRVGDGVQVYAMPIPLASAFYAPEGYESSITSAVNCFGGLRDALVDVQYVDLLEALGGHTAEEIYARTDHHWHALGAYYASEALCAKAGVPFATLDGFTKQSFEGFLGSVYNTWGVSELRNYPETFIWYEPKQEYTAHYYSHHYNFSFSGSLFSTSKSYVKFIYGDSYAVRVETGVQNGRKMLVIKDSFGNALAPFLIAGFEEVYVVDFRDFQCNVLEFIEENQITDVTFALSAFSVAGSKRNNITRLMNQ